MPDITLSDEARINDPKLKAMADRVAGVLKAAATKATANLADPGRFPLSAQPTSLERVMRGHLAGVPVAGRDVARRSVLAKIADPAWKKKEFGEVAALNLESPTAVEEQDAVAKLPAISVAGSSAPAAMAAAPAQNRELALRIHRVTCRDDTSEPFKDEIHLGGTSVDETGDTKAVQAFKVRSFNKGDTQTYNPPKRFTFFNVREGGTKFPKSYSIALILVEKDMGDLAGFLDKLADQVREYLKKELIKAGSTKGPIGVIVALVLTYVLGKVFDYLKRLWGDEIFDPKQLRIDLPTATHRFPGGKLDSVERTLVYTGHGGKYEVVYDWALSA